MTNAILIGEVIATRLLSSETLKTYVENKVFPLIADNDTKFPFIVYKRTGVSVINQSKDGYNEDLVSYEITVVSTKYDESITIANEIRKIMERPRIETTIMTLYDNKIMQVIEEFTDNCFIQKLTFNCKIN